MNYLIINPSHATVGSFCHFPAHVKLSVHQHFCPISSIYFLCPEKRQNYFFMVTKEASIFFHAQKRGKNIFHPPKRGKIIYSGPRLKKVCQNKARHHAPGLDPRPFNGKYFFKAPHLSTNLLVILIFEDGFAKNEKVLSRSPPPLFPG